MVNYQIIDIINQAHGLAKTCNLAQTVDSTISELNGAINSNRIDDKTNVLRKVLIQCGDCICQAKGIQNLPQWLAANRYFEQADAAMYNRDLIWLRDEIVPQMATIQLCKMMAEKAAENNLRQMGCSPQLILMLKAMFG